MKWISTVFCVTTAFCFSTCAAKTALAQESPSQPEIIADRIFYLDWGFVGRPVSLSLDGGSTVISWDAGDLLSPNILHVEIRKTATSSADGVGLGGKIVHLSWSAPYALSQRGVHVQFSDAQAGDSWTRQTVYRRLADMSWKEATDGWVYGHAFVMSGAKRLSYMRQGDASWYKYKNCRCAASPDFPKGTRLLVKRKDKPAKFTVVRINDYGPERNIFPERAIDLDAVAFAELASLRAGVIQVEVEPLSSDDPLYALADLMPVNSSTVLVANSTTR